MTEEPEQPEQPTQPYPCPEPVEEMRSFSMNSREFTEFVTDPSVLGSCPPRQGGTGMPPVVPGVEWR